jgi:ubiquinone/menaquinone biosynthesis C-methylase UbiE
MNVLEVGCGVGYFTKEIIKTNAKVIAIDISPDLLQVAKENVKGSNLTFKVDNAYKLNFPECVFDTIIGSSVLHHLDVVQALKEFNRTLKPGGTLFFTEPNMANPQVFLQKNISVFKKLAGDSPDETAFFRSSLKKVFQNCNFRDIQITPFDFLHPQTPSVCIPLVKRMGEILEDLPVFREIAGSLFITAKK